MAACAERVVAVVIAMELSLCAQGAGWAEAVSARAGRSGGVAHTSAWPAGSERASARGDEDRVAKTPMPDALCRPYAELELKGPNVPERLNAWR
ncbi:hypothetical protein GCM10022270_07440 [Terriglobus aquaticus]